MKRETGFRIAVAVLSIVAVGASATSIQSTVTTDASDVIDPDYDRLPLDRGQGAEISRQINEPAENGDVGSSDSDGTDGADGSESESSASASQASDQQSQSADRQQSDDTSRQQSAADDEQETSADTGEGPSPGMPDLLDRLLALLSDALPALVTFLLAVAASEAVARYRDRLLAAVGLAADEPENEAEVTEPESAEVPERAPANAVERAWAEMRRRLDVDRTGHMTPEEVARAAVDAGFDPEAVRTLTETFVEVRYGDRPVTADRERAASRLQRQFDGGREVADGGREIADGDREVTDGGETR